MEYFDTMTTHKLPAGILSKIPITTFLKGQRLINQGDPCSYVYYLCTGKIQVFDERDQGEVAWVVWINPGQIVGEMEVLAEMKSFLYSASIYSDKATILQIPVEDFWEWMRTDSGFCREMAQSMAKKLVDTVKALQKFLYNDAIHSVTEFILDQCYLPVLEQRTPVKIKHTRIEIAGICHISERTVNRSIKALKEENLVTIQRGKITVTRKQYEKLLQRKLDGEDDFI